MSEISIKEGVFTYDQTVFKAEILEKAFEQFLKEKIAKNEINDFLTQRKYPILHTNMHWVMDNGISSSVLIPGNPTWLTGKVRIRVKVEFIPDKPVEQRIQETPLTVAEPSSPLDQIRQEIQPS